MIASLRITGFRAFSDLSVERVGRVTLIVGRNNVGKTTLLEAVHLHASGANVLTAAARMLERRHEFEESELGDVDFMRLFFRPSDSHVDRFRISDIEQNDTLEVSTVWSWWEGQEEETNRRTGTTPPKDSDAELRLLAKHEGHDDVSIALDPQGGYYHARKRIRMDDRRPSSLLLPSAGFQAEEVDAAVLWDSIVLTDGEDHVMRAMQIIEPGLERIALVNAPKRRRKWERVERAAVAKIHGRAPLPLRSLGDGMNRLFELALGVVTVRQGGTFSVDEIDSGLHFTALIDVWRLIFESARALNVQVFATTHSWDCIQAFQQVAVDYPSDAILTRLQRAEDTLISEVFQGDELTIITREGIEVR